MTTATPMRAGALFAGYGGIELALHEVFGATPAWFSEFDKAPSAILAHRWPGVPNLGDVTAIRWTPDCPTCGASTYVVRSPGALRMATGYECTACSTTYPLALREQQQRETGVPIAEPVDIIGGGSPCQDLSHAGKRAGMVDGTRSGLWASMVAAIRLQRPSFVVWENVRGAYTAEGEPPTPEILALEADRDRTARAIATVKRRHARATANGETAHVAYHARDAVRLARRHRHQVGAVRRARSGLVRALGRVVGDLAALGYDAAWAGLRAADVGAPHGRSRVFVLAWPAADTGRARWEGPDVAGAQPSRRGQGGMVSAGHSWTGPAPDGVALLRTPTAQLAVNGGSQHPEKRKGGGHGPTLADELEHLDFAHYAPVIARWERLTRPAPAPTEPTGKGGAHRLSPAFVEWLMGLPAGWVTDPAIGITRNDQLKALGNGVVPQQCAAALRHLLAVRDMASAAAA